MTNTTAYYLMGDRFEFTGHTETLHGQLGYEIVMLEGHRKGELLWTYRTPAEYQLRYEASQSGR